MAVRVLGTCFEWVYTTDPPTQPPRARKPVNKLCSEFGVSPENAKLTTETHEEHLNYVYKYTPLPHSVPRDLGIYAPLFNP